MPWLVWLAGSALYFWWLRSRDRTPGAKAPLRPLSIHLTFFGFGLISVLTALVFYGPWQTAAVALAGSRLADIFYMFLVVGPAEELGKFTAFLLAVRLTRALKGPQSGVLLGALVGLGFGVLENLIYMLRYDPDTIYLRTLFSLPGHLIYAALWGGYFSLEVHLGNGKVRKWSTIVLALFVPAFFHGLYNTLLRFGDLPAILTDVGALIFALVLFANLRKM